jgi:hypothetical protein
MISGAVAALLQSAPPRNARIGRPISDNVARALGGRLELSNRAEGGLLLPVV